MKIEVTLDYIEDSISTGGECSGLVLLFLLFILNCLDLNFFAIFYYFFCLIDTCLNC